MKFIFVSLFILLQACSTKTVIDYDTALEDNKHLVMFSITETGTPCSMYGCFPTVIFKQIATQSLIYVPDNSINADNDGMYVGLTGDYSHFDDVWGKVYFIELPVGTYNIFDWVIETHIFPLGNIRVRSTNDPNKNFNVIENQITYIGNLNLEVLYTNAGGVNTLSGANFTVNDNFNRDLAAAKNKYSKFNSVNVVKDIAK